jgi:NADH-quinone oxidoreductase subunit G
MGALMLGFAQKGGMADLSPPSRKVVLALGADEVEFGPFEGALKVYIGHQATRARMRRT